MDFGISGKNALVTGSSKGLGKAAALRLAEEGSNVVINGRTKSTLEEAAKEIREISDNDVIPIQADMTNKEEIQNLVSEAENQLTTIDICVANAGGPPVGEFEEFTDSDWQHAFELNLLSSVRLARQTVPKMANRGWGRMIFITSIAVKEPLDGFLLSNSVRLGVEGLAKTLSNRYASEGVNVTCAQPGYTNTKRLEDIPQEEHDEITSNIPVRRFGEPEEFGDVIAFLASERASNVTGASVPVDGGFSDGVL